MFRRFSLRDLAQAFPSRAFERGRRYFEQARVRHVDVTDHPGGILGVRGEVLGSSGQVYVQELELEWSDDGLDVFSHCSCPVGFDCKHVVAVCLTVRRYLAGGTDDAEGVEARLRRWLCQVQSAGEPRSAGNEGERLIYVLLPREHRAAGLGVELRLVRSRKQGGQSKGRLVRLERLSESRGCPEFASDDDEQITRMLRALCPDVWEARPEFRGRLGFLALERMLATGRCTFAAVDSPPLSWGEERPLEITWRERDDARLTLEIGAGADTSVLPTDPPSYVDGGQARVGILKTTLRPAQVAALLAAPSMVAGDAAPLARLLANEFPALMLPMPSEAAAIEAERHPLVPCLTLIAPPGTEEGGGEIHLGFSYGGRTVQALPRSSQSLLDGGRRPVRLHRDLEAEDAALSRLTGIGFERLPPAAHSRSADHSHTCEELRLASTGDTLVERLGRWSVLVNDVVPELAREGWHIVRDESFKLRFSPGRWHARVEPARRGNDWFSLGFDLEVEGQRLPLLPLLIPLIEHGFHRPLPPRVSVPLPPAADGERRCVDLPVERLVPFLDTLENLFDEGKWPSGAGALPMTRFDAGVVARLSQQGTPVEAPPALEDLARRLAGFTGIRHVPPPPGLNVRLRGYQQDGLNWLQFLAEHNLGGILADDMGLGKTVQTLAHLLVEKDAGRLDRPALIVAPTSLMGNWRREAARFTPSLSVLVLQGARRQEQFERIGGHDLVITTYPLLPRDRPVFEGRPWHAVILDEAQTVKNPRSKAASVIRALDARHRLCLTGTPMENHLGELWAQFDFLLPGFLGSEETFRRRWRRPIEERGDEGCQQRLARRVAPFLLRRRKVDVLRELPPKTEILKTVSLGERQAALYESVRLAMDERVRHAIAAQGLARSHITILDALLKLRQICCDPRLLALEAARGVTGSAKLELLMQMLPPMIEEGRRVLVFSQFTSMLALIEAELVRRSITFTKLTGQTRGRDEVVERFRGGEADVFLLSLKAGGVGLNLTEADTVILYDPWWNPAVEVQAADRAHRIGQSQQVFVYQLVTEGTVEERILALQERKRSLAEGVYAPGGGTHVLGLEPGDLEELLAPRE